MSDYKKLKVWEDAHKFTVDIYNITQKFPNNEEYKLLLAKIQSIIRRLTNLIKSLKNHKLKPINRKQVLNPKQDDRRES